jgi:hypothetical protein
MYAVLLKMVLILAVNERFVFASQNAPDSAVADQIWCSMQNSTVCNVLYLVTSCDSSQSQSLFEPIAMLHYSRLHSNSDEFTQSETCGLEGTKDCEIIDSARERKAHLWRHAEKSFSGISDYFVFIDLAAGWSNITSKNLLEFQRNLFQRNPAVAVPFHRCNTKDTSSVSVEAISSIYDTSFLAVSGRARKLLLPLQESLISLICHLMIRNGVLQFRIGSSSRLNVVDPDCSLQDTENQQDMIDFVTSLQSKHYLDAVPFFPRIHSPAIPTPVRFTANATISLPFLDGSCVRCEHPYWHLHPVFECCMASSIIPQHVLNVSSAQSSIWNFLHPSMLAKSSDVLTHPLPRFKIVLSGKNLMLDDACFQQTSLESSEYLRSFNLFVIPEKLDLHPSGSQNVLDIQLQVTISALESEQEFCAVFAKINEVTVTAICDGRENTSVVAAPFSESQSNSMQSNLENDVAQHDAAPWFYSPAPSWHHVSSGILDSSTDILNTRSFDVTVVSSCREAVSVSVRAKVALLRLCQKQDENRVRSCSGHILVGESPNVTHSAHAEARRSPVSTEDLFDTHYRAPSLNEDARKMFSDFWCAGPNRHWPYKRTNHYNGPEVMVKSGAFNMCMMQNACWINKMIVLFLPEHFSELMQLGFFDFRNVVLTKEFGNSFAPHFTLGSIPQEAVFAADIVHYAMQRNTTTVLRELRNFGHTVWEELGSIFHAVHLFDLPRDDGRIVLLTDHSQPKLLPPLFPRSPVYIDEFPNGTCFKQMVVGFAGVGSLEQGFQLYRPAHSVEFRNFYSTLFNVTHLMSKHRRGRSQIVVNMYPKVVVGNLHVWSDVCKFASTLSPTYPKLQFRCVSLHQMSFEVQAQVIAEATIHIWPNGGSAYGLLFAADGSSAILLSETTAKETNVLTFLPWASVYYLSREEEIIFPIVFSRALHAAAARMNLCPALYSPDSEDSSCDIPKLS